MKPAAWLILGGHGYVGAHLGRALRRGGEEVVAKGRADADLRAGVDPDWISAADAVVLAAGPVRAPTEAALRADNLRVAEQVARAYAAADARPPLFFLSSLHVYARSPHPLALDAPTEPPRSPYGAVKLACEALLADAAARHGYPLWIGRAGNLVAPEAPLNPASFVADMRAALRRDGCIVVPGDPRRDLVWIADLARGLAARRRGGLAPGGVRRENACTGRPVELARVAAAAVAQWRARGAEAQWRSAPGEADAMVGVPEGDRAWGDGPTAEALGRLIAAP